MTLISNKSNISLEELIKIKHKNIKEFEKQAINLAEINYHNGRFYSIFRIAKELQDLYCDTEYCEKLIIQSRDPFFIFKFAREIKQANIANLQQAIIDIGNLDYIAGFACFINGANVELLENLILNSNNAKAVYTYLKYGKHANINKFKHILIRSKKPRYLYLLAQLTSNQEDINLIQDLIIAGHSNMYVRLFAKNIPGADISKLENRILNTKNLAEIKKFALTINSDKLRNLLLLL